SVAYRHVNDDVPAPSTVVPGIPAALDDLVLRATRRDAEARPADAAKFLAELRRVKAELGVRTATIPVATPPDAPRISRSVPAEADSELTVPAIPALTEHSGTGPRSTHTIPRAITETAKIHTLPTVSPPTLST